MKTVAIVGNPNCGKTTIFNALTGSRQSIGNWPGVTVEKKEVSACGCRGNCCNLRTCGELFAKLTDGDKVLVFHSAIAESYPAQTGVYGIFKLSDGSITDIPDEVLDILTDLGWRTAVKMELPEIMPEDFSFALTWGCYGISSYDSKTGKLVKTTDATHPEDYVTTYKLYEDEAERIYEFIRALNVNDYPEIYNPHKDGLASSPSMTLILTVRVGDRERMIKAENIALTYESGNQKGQDFLTSCDAIRGILTSSVEWNALPEYEFYYD
jgi:hypothetical protein